jgi:hypothetical protein
VRYLACKDVPNFSWCDWTSLEAEADKKKVKQVLLKTGMVDSVILYAPGSVNVSVDETKILFHPNLNVGWFRTGIKVRGIYATELTYNDDGRVLRINGFTNPA